MTKGIIKIQFTQDFACKTTGEVWECSLDMAGNLIKDKKAIYHTEEIKQTETIKPIKNKKAK